MDASEWFMPLAMNALQEAPARMFVFPFAGGNPKDFQVDALTSIKLDVWALCYPGRGKRRKEANISDIRELVPLVAEALRPHLDVPFCFLGYSMGALVAYETCRFLERHGHPKPRCVFVVADEAPQTQKAFIDTELGDAEFAKALGDLGLTSRDVLESEEMLAVVLPQIRADMTIENKHVYSREPLLGAPIVALCGTEDRWVDEPRMRPWGENTAAEFELTMLPGAGHIFLQDEGPMAALRACLIRWCSRTKLIERFARGPEEAEEVTRVEREAAVRKLGNCWVKWDAARGAPKRKPAASSSREPPGLGAWFSDVREQLELRGYGDMLDPSWG
eukprot:TRINITY_DN55763_c0_g1_i1.p1 TRINITY_DN55763_c0_g1~~TRINITY_DN55763_c0_g1_i1.p1  ORF type:complete len:363 (+),score=136.70 TRINITY_DN55763_c0_g1_i1:93-1091(+)